MAVLYCDRCGGTLELDTDGDYYCGNCCIWLSIPDDQKHYYEDPTAYTRYNDEDDSDFEQGCKACGNPAYPECKAGCPLFDD